KGKAARQAIRRAGAKQIFLPKYSPDLNPIEQAFAKLKTRPSQQADQVAHADDPGTTALDAKADLLRDSRGSQPLTRCRPTFTTRGAANDRGRHRPAHSLRRLQ